MCTQKQFMLVSVGQVICTKFVSVTVTLSHDFAITQCTVTKHILHYTWAESNCEFVIAIDYSRIVIIVIYFNFEIML